MQNDIGMKRFFSLFLLIFGSYFLTAQTKTARYKTDLDFGGGIVITTFLKVDSGKGEFKITSPKNADVRIMGGKARLGRLMGKLPKKGSIVTITGTQKGDSLHGESAIPMIGKVKFKGVAGAEKLTGDLLNTAGTKVGTVSGLPSTQERMSYTDLYPKLIKTVSDNIYSKSALQTIGWKEFEADLKELCEKAHDDVELYFGVNMLAQKLPFSHLTFLIGDDPNGESESESESESKPNDVPKQKSVVFEQRTPSTAYLQIKNFSSSQEELEATLPTIVSNPAIKNLIIDLRNNGGGGVGPAFALAKYIATEDIEVGYFVTNKLQYSGFDATAFGELPSLQPQTTQEFGDFLRTSPGAKLVFKKPANPVFTGKIYVLTNGRTGSTCEPLVYALKSTKKATIVGENTAGAMLAASPYAVSGKYMFMLPIADFYTHDGKRLDRVGVAPDVSVKSEDAEKKALELIGQSAN